MVAVLRALLCASLCACAPLLDSAHVKSAATDPPSLAPLPSTQESDWPMFRHDAERSGSVPGATVGAGVRMAWQLPRFNSTGYGAVKGSPAVVGDRVYCGTDTGRFVAVRASDGSVAWEISIAPTTHGIHGSPAVVGDVVYVGAYDGTIYAFDRETGRARWTHRLGYQIGSSPAVVPRWGELFTANEESARGGGFVVALDARSGEELWRHRIDAHAHSSVAVDEVKGMLFVGDNLGVVHAFDRITGEERWRRELDARDGKADVKTTPTVIAEDNLVVFGAWSGKVYALDERTGEVVWEHETGGKIMGSTAYSAAASAVFAVSPRGRVFAIDVFTGRTRWVRWVRATILSSPAVSGDGKALVFGAGDGVVYALHADTGEPLWEYYVGGQVTGSPALVGRRIYVTSKRGALTALETFEP